VGFLRRNAVALVALFVALGGGAYAATNGFVGPSGVISGCVPAKGGKLTVVKPGHACPRGTVSLKFNQQGKTGRRGAAGKQGLPGSELVANVKSTAHASSTTVTTSPPCAGNPFFTPCPDSAHGAVVPLSGGSWTQAAHQFDIPYGQVVVSEPSQSTCSSYSPTFMFPEAGQMVGEVDDTASGTPLGTFSATASPTTPTTQTIQIALSPLFQRPTAVVHHITVKVADNCGTGGGSAVGTAHFTVDSFHLNMVGVS
jgi:hypothetical protein